MSRLIQKQPIDWEKPLPNEKQENFCQEYVRLDMEDGIKQARARRIMAYKFAFPDARDDVEGKLNSRASKLLKDDNIVSRLTFLYEELGAGIENEVKWNKTKAEDVLLDIIYGEEKTENKLKALDMLNKLREVGVKKEEDEEKQLSTVEAFFNKLKGKA